MTTLAEWMQWIEERAVKDGDCLVWQMCFNKNNPQSSIERNGVKRSLNIRRVLWEAKYEKTASKGWVVMCTCDTFGCVNPDHLKLVSRSQMLKGRALSLSHRLHVTQSARNRSTNKLDQDAVNDIRYGEGTRLEKAARHGITTEYVDDIIAHRCWRELTNPFTQLIAA